MKNEKLMILGILMLGVFLSIEISIVFGLVAIMGGFVIWADTKQALIFEKIKVRK